MDNHKEPRVTEQADAVEQALCEAYPRAAQSLGEIQDRVIEMRGFRKGYAAALTRQAAPEAPTLFDAEFLSKRLARVAKLVGAHIPEHFTHEQVAETAGTILGDIARKLEAAATQQAGAATCQLPPPGWACTRTPDHEGPCAAWPTAEIGEKIEEKHARPDDQGASKNEGSEQPKSNKKS